MNIIIKKSFEIKYWCIYIKKKKEENTVKKVNVDLIADVDSPDTF